MAGTDKSRRAEEPGTDQSPVVVLVEPQLGENIGAAARAMANFGLRSLRLVAPRDPWPNEQALRSASGADWIIEGATVHDTLEAAIGDLGLVMATTARDRAMTKPVIGPKEAVRRIAAQPADGPRSGLLFGRERWGLTNDEIAVADVILTYPVNPAFASLNLGQAVLLFGYEWFASVAEASSNAEGAPLAEKADLLRLYEHLETELDRGGFLKPPEKRERMVHNIRSILARADLTDQDVRTLRGIIVALTGRPFRPAEPADAADISE